MSQTIAACMRTHQSALLPSGLNCTYFRGGIESANTRTCCERPQTHQWSMGASTLDGVGRYNNLNVSPASRGRFA